MPAEVAVQPSEGFDPSSFDAVKWELREHTAYITMSRPDARNALNIAMRNELMACFDEVQNNDQIWLAVLCGEDPIFCAGADLKEKLNMARSDGDKERSRLSNELYLTMRRCFKPIIAAINGGCIAQGAGLALLSDIRIISEKGYFWWPQVMRGISSMSGPLLLTEATPPGFALRYLLTADKITPEEALRVDLCTEVVPHEELMEAVERWADKMLKNAPLSLQAIKEVSVRRRGMTIDDAFPIGRDISERTMDSEDSIEGLKAFKEKRPPEWQGR
ncbi:MAG: hypothetical protein CMM48_13420 [Rhodospirillaceae bacterium]|nr:hypothetical protein [Rhodospirillaceae bacterium]